MNTTTARATSKLSSALSRTISGEPEAHGFRRFLASVQIEARVSRLVVEGRDTDFFQILVAARHVKRAEDMHTGWNARRAFEFEQDAASHDEGREPSESLAEYHRTGHVSDDLRRMLADASASLVSGWDYPSCTVSCAKRQGYVEAVEDGKRTLYTITDAGRAVLATTSAWG